MNNPRVLYLALCVCVGVVNGWLASAFVKAMWAIGVDPVITLVIGFAMMILGIHLLRRFVLDPLEEEIGDD